MNALPKVHRHFGMDWLRIGAFAILIVYHTALYFGPHSWVVRARETFDWLIFPLSAIAPWRLMVLFAVSGFATAAMLSKIGDGWRFFRERSFRILIPLFFGMIVLIPPQSWVRSVTEGVTTLPYLHFWTSDYFRFGNFHGHTVPHWEHLWFLGYLWAYTGILVLLIATIPDWMAKAQALISFLAKRYRLLILPILFLVGARIGMTKMGLLGGGMFNDWIGDAHYFPALVFGFLLAIMPEFWVAIRRVAKPAAIIALAAYGVIAVTFANYGSVEEMPTWCYAAYLAADSTMGWAAMLAFVGLAHTVLNRDHPLRATFARAVFPAYLLHQTVIVILGFWLLPLALPGWIAFPLLVIAVCAASAAAWFLASRVRWIGMLLGVVLPEKPVKSRLAAI